MNILSKLENEIAIGLNKLIVPLLKFYPIVMNFFVLIIYFEYKFDDKYTISVIFAPYLGYSLIITLLLIGLSERFKFCLWHRLLCYNMLLNMIYIIIDIHGLLFYAFTVSTAFVLLTSMIKIYKHGFKRKKL